MDLIDVGFLALLLALMVFTLVWFFWGKLDKVKAKAESSAIDLTLLSKEDYDFLRTNGLEVTQEVHDHFYEPFRETLLHGHRIYRQPLDKWGDEALVLDSRMSPRHAQEQAKLAFEQRRGVQQQEELLEKARYAKGERQAIVAAQQREAYDPNMLQWKPWMDSENVRG